MADETPDTADSGEAAAAAPGMAMAAALTAGLRDAGGSMRTIGDMDGSAKAAVVLLAVGPEAAADVFRQLSPFEVQRVAARMASVRALSRELVLEVLREFKANTSDNAQVSFNTDDFMENMLNKALGMEGAADLLGRLESAIDMSGIESLTRMEPDVLFEVIKNEHPQIIATVFVFLQPAQASAVSKLFPTEERNEILLRVALLEKVQPAALKELNDVMSRVASSDAAAQRSNVGGVGPTADILNFLGEGIDQEALDHIRSYDEPLAERILELMFTFEDLIEIEDRSLQTLLLEVPQALLVVALKGASPRLREKLLKNMAKRAAEGVREDLATRGPVKVQEVEEAQKEMLRTGRLLAAEGRMIMERNKQSDAFL
jgi:flagellar motor switch protein FliG